MISIDDYVTQYQSLLLDYSQKSSENLLYQCSELGKSMALKQLSPEDVITLHENAVKALQNRLTKSQIIASFDLLSEVSVQQTLWLKREMELKTLAQKKIIQKEQIERSIISSFPDTLIKLSMDLVVLDKNNLFDEVFPGINPKSADDFLDMFESREDINKLHNYVLRTHKRMSIRTSVKRKCGVPISCEVTLVLIGNLLDKKQGFLCIIRDLSAQEEIHSQLEVAQRMVEDVIEAVPLRIYWKDFNLRYLGCNKAYLNDIDIKSETEILLKTGKELSENALQFSDIGMEKKVIERELAYTRCERKIKTDSQRLDILQTVHPLKGLDGSIYGIICCYEDISKLKRQEKETKRLEEQLKQSERLESIGRLAGGISHDFNNIVSVVLGYSQMIERSISKVPTDKTLGYVERISDAAQKAKLLTERLLTFSRKKALDLKPVEMHKHIENTLSTYGSIIGEDLIVSLETDKTHWISADISQLDQVILNLLVNAKDAMSESTKPIEKRIDVKLIELPERSQVRLTVEDSGLGIPPELKDKIFDPFFTTKSNNGTGLGLATILGIVLQNNAQIAIDSELGRGTKVMIDWPLIDEPLGCAQKQQFKFPPVKVSGKNIHPIVCVVEDEEPVRQLISEILNENGFIVYTFDRGSALFDTLNNRTFVPNLLISDVILPEGENGLKISEKFLRLYPSAQRILISGYSHDVLSQKDLSLKNMTFIPKPFSLEHFVNIVNSKVQAR